VPASLKPTARRYDGPIEATGEALPSKTWALRCLARVLAAEAHDRLRRRGPIKPGELPRSPRDLSAEWLTAALCSGTAGARVASVAVVGESTGTTSRATLELAYDETGVATRLPTRVFVKCTSTIAQRVMLGLGGFIEGEAGFYTHVRPELEIEAPVGHFAGVDRRSWRSVVGIEDVASTRGATFWQPSARVARESVEDLLACAAQWHGMLWDSSRLRGWRWLRTPAEHMELIDTLIGLADRRRAGAQRARAVIPSALRDRQADLYAALRRSMQIASQGPRTYLHGDLHIANTYLTAEGRMGVCDWQVGLQGSWAYDFGYLLTTALEVQERRAWERGLLESYLERLAAAGGPRIAWSEAWQAYRQATLYPYFAWVYTIGRSRLQPRFQPEATSLVMIRRIAAAIEDLDSLGAVGL
jgi:hypothetical protein